VSWLLRLSRGDREIIEARSLNPPESFRMISEKAQPARSREWARKAYKRAIAAVAKTANTPTGLAQPVGVGKRLTVLESIYK
jgi:hypothetical protein